MSIRYSKYLPGFIFITDIILLNLAVFVANYFPFENNHQNKYGLFLFLIVNISWLVVSYLSKNFRIKRPLLLRENLNRFLLTLIYHLLVVFSIFYFLKLFNYSRLIIVIGYGLFFCFVILFRSLVFFSLDYVRKKGFNHRQVIIIGDKNIADRLLESFSDHPEYGYDLLDFIPEEAIETTPENVLTEILLGKRPDEIFICYKQLDNIFLKRIIKFGNENYIKIKVVSDLILNNNAAQLVNYSNLPVLHITQQPEIAMKIKLLKRSFDIVFSSCVMVTGVPVFLVMYIITKTTSKGPAFYKQQRVGRNEKPFYIYKFRSMYVDSEKLGPQLSSDNDPRITKWGRVIRKTRLDEIPQFWNVLKGEMSVVGPRPERQHFIEQILERTPHHRKLLCVKPGLTSIGQVYYGYAENVNQMRDRSRYDLLYLHNMSLNSDLNIIFKTVRVMVQRKGK